MNVPPSSVGLYSHAAPAGPFQYQVNPLMPCWSFPRFLGAATAFGPITLRFPSVSPVSTSSWNVGESLYSPPCGVNGWYSPLFVLATPEARLPYNGSPATRVAAGARFGSRV